MLKIMGPPDAVEKTAALIEGLVEVFEKGGQILPPPQMRYAVANAREGAPEDIRELAGDYVEVQRAGRRVAPMTAGQKRYIEAIRANDIVFGTGPAGTGKTYLAMSMAVNALLSGRARRIVLVRPAVEAGEKLGFLPGDLREKLDPYVRPLYDALYDMMDASKVMDYLESGVIEIAPLAFMRGRTLNDAFILLDEAQNTSVEQMKMFLTRLGFDSKAVITGDATQIDLERGKMSGLVHAEKILRDIPGIAFVRFEQRDIVRHSLVQRIVEAYERAGEDEAAAGMDRGWQRS
jgi:phosphate starvation-inducible PhoH-like protein